MTSAGGTELAEEAMPEKAELEATVGVDAAREAGEREGAVEVRPTVEEDAEGDYAVHARASQLFEERAERGELAGVEAERGESVPEGAVARAGRGERRGRGRGGGEEHVEGGVEAWAVRGALHDD